nr:uncharacterized protein LOC113696212 [Coffea arabica]XP_027071406.1 uncharacterized protein LOC113696212 [Coffea arabica]XP_027071407.1 uncharacterized protein LOC113696212 [Coffea arabica]XP_027071408.1 uncharacterized protein LOC113696212 [Coffea arabica]
MEDESAIPVLEDEAIQFECLLVEPQDDHVSVDAFLCFHRNSPEKCMEMEDIPCKFGGDNFGTDPERKHLLGQERGLDIKHSEIEAENFLAPNGPSSVCEDYLLDADFGENGKNLDHDSSIELQKLVSGSYDPADNAGDNETSHKSDLSGPTVLNKCMGDPDMNDSTSHDIFSCTADSEMSLEERWFKYPTFTVENMEEDVSSLFLESNNKTMGCTHNVASGEVLCPLTANQETKHVPMGENKNVSLLGKDASPSKSPIQASIATHAEKRLRKPPQRFIDELSEPKSRPPKRREVSTPSSRGKFPRVGSHKHCDIKSRAERLSSEDSAGKAIQVPFGPIVHKEGRTSCALPLVPKESRASRAPIVAKVLQLDKKPLLQPHKQAFVPRHKEAVLQPHKEAVLQPHNEASVDESEEDDIAEVKLGEDGGRRKHHILWTVSEVKKLIDGVSEYGVGRWSRIKKDLFPSSAHRTPVDLKDKWRNLLKASCAQIEGKKGEDRKRNLAWRPLPKTILRRVSELATIHPYPRDLRSKR